jgi:N6-L-threonylcarbamoyladenine synthase
MVYVLNIQGNPLMPCGSAKARKLLRDNLARVVKRTPFTIQLVFECENYTQDIILGVDAGSKMVGLSATTDKK